MTSRTNLAPVDLDNGAEPAGQNATDALWTSDFWRQLVDRPYRADLFAVLRWVDSRKKDGQNAPLLGRAARPLFDVIRLGQEPALTFAASTIADVSPQSGDIPPRINIFGFGLFGPNGPLPLHMTEYARDRLQRYNDPTLAHFADIFHHRAILLFYRAWADAQPSVNMDRADADRFTNYTASLIGYGHPSMRARDGVADHAKLFSAVHLARQTRNPEGLLKILRTYLQVPVAVDEFVIHWIDIERDEQTRLTNNGNNGLGKGAFLGERILDCQHKIRLRLGPMSQARYSELLPGGKGIKQIGAWIRNYVGYELRVDVQLVLRKEEVPQARLGMGQLGWTTWQGERGRAIDADDLVIECEA
jgi:type VI secretion system protein ImpH